MSGKFDGVEGIATAPPYERQLVWDQLSGNAEKTSIFESMRRSLSQSIDAS